jgi:uncharacterized protein YjaG (DUF416 family)
MKAILRFSRTQLIRKLDRLPLPLRLIFAAACAERLFPAYVTASNLTGKGDPEMLARLLARLWEDIAGDPMAESEVQASISAGMNLIPEDYHEPWFVEQASAEDASIAVVYALTCRQSGDSKDAMWSAEHVYNALDHFLINRENIDLNAPEAESRLQARPLIQAELARQRRDVDELLGDVDADVQQIAVKFRERAKAEAKIFFNVFS